MFLAYLSRVVVLPLWSLFFNTTSYFEEVPKNNIRSLTIIKPAIEIPVKGLFSKSSNKHF